MNYLLSHDIDAKEKHKIQNKGLFCYDLRLSDMGDEIANIEKSVLVNRFGSIITNEELTFGDNPTNDYIDFQEFISRKENKEVFEIEELYSTEQIIKKSTELIKKNKDLKGKVDLEDLQINYILDDVKNRKEIIVLAMADGELINVNPFTKKVDLVDDRYYLIDKEILEELKNNKVIAYMSMETHYELWLRLNEWYPDDISKKAKEGMQIYLKYCKKHKITKETIEKTLKVENIPDIMKYYKKKQKER